MDRRLSRLAAAADGGPALESVLEPEQIVLRFGGHPFDRLGLLLDRHVAAANIFGAPYYIAEQMGFRRVLDTTFMIGFLATGEASNDELEKYFRAMKRAQRDIDLEPERYKHYLLKGLPEEYHSLVEVQRFGPGERVVFEPYTREMFERTHRWMESWELFDSTVAARPAYEDAVLA